MSEAGRVMIVEDQKLTRLMLALFIDQQTEYAVAGSASTAEEAMALLPRVKPDVVLMDLGLPGMNGIEAIRKIKSESPNVEVIVLTIFDRDEAVFESLKAGASGYLLKDSTPEDIVAALDTLTKHDGAPMSPVIAKRVLEEFRRNTATGTPTTLLTRREREILELLARGSAYKQIADTLKISFGTVQSHIKNLYQKLQVNSKTEAVSRAMGRPIRE
ncbi:MAG: response regulator transcription factor [Nitrospirae bacterium]|nr:response regulator transcription factor [Nitrospirota bacterium]